MFILNDDNISNDNNFVKVWLLAFKLGEAVHSGFESYSDSVLYSKDGFIDLKS